MGGWHLLGDAQRRLGRRLGPALAIFFVCAMLAACGSAKQDYSLAKDAVGTFHSDLDAERYDAIYAMSDGAFRKATNEADLTKILQAIHGKLGTIKQSQMQNVNLSWYLGQGTDVTLVYGTSFSAGSGTEQFVWHITGGRALLVGYHINSADLIEK